jgi:hypothetical protein
MTFPTLREVERQLHISAARLAPEFAIFKGVAANLGPEAFGRPALLGFYLRAALEAEWFIRRGIGPGLARMAASRVAAEFIQAEAEALSAADRAALPGWVAAMAGEVAPAAAFLARHFAASAAEIELIRGIWALLGTAEALMETGGDIRLARDPRSALNGYGCSHRPRPWAVTFASSTASSSSERGYAAVDRARLRTTLALLRGVGRRQAVRDSLNGVRRELGCRLGLPQGSKVVLAASGTDTELLALALTHVSGADAPILNILIAPEETGRGVPMAARGVHFAVDTALGHDVTFQAPIAGFRADTALVNVLLREKSGALRGQAEIEAEIYAAVAAGLGEGRRVLLHVLDLSKTGLLAPSMAFLGRLRAEFGGRFDVVVDACQARLSPESVRRYLALDAVVLITGSKFFTGPPFAGAAILPGAVAARLEGAALPAGLEAYFGRDDFPARCPAARGLPPVGNYGLALRWYAALAEMKALLRVPPVRRAEILAGFGQAVRAALATQPELALLEAPPMVRYAGEEDWERLPTIFTFSLRAPHEPSRCLHPAEARSVYLWLNTDLSPLFPQEARVAARICHIGQPVPLAQPQGEGMQGALRVSAGARLISGEPSHRGLAAKARLAREFTDLGCVFEKIRLILRHWAALSAANPAPCYRPVQAVRKEAAGHEATA